MFYLYIVERDKGYLFIHSKKIQNMEFSLFRISKFGREHYVNNFLLLHTVLTPEDFQKLLALKVDETLEVSKYFHVTRVIHTVTLSELIPFLDARTACFATEMVRRETGESEVTFDTPVESYKLKNKKIKVLEF